MNSLEQEVVLKNKEMIELLSLIEKQKPQKADAIIWLQGDRYDRSRKVLSLFKKKWANKIVVSGNNDLESVSPERRKCNISLEEMISWLKKRGIKDSQVLIDDKSFNTGDQANNVLKLAKKKKWEKIILVASLYHQMRAFLTFLKRAKEINWKGKLINQPAKISWQKTPAGKERQNIEMLRQEIKKIKKYKGDAADFAAGINYLKKHDKTD